MIDDTIRRRLTPFASGSWIRCATYAVTGPSRGIVLALLAASAAAVLLIGDTVGLVIAVAFLVAGLVTWSQRRAHVLLLTDDEFIVIDCGPFEMRTPRTVIRRTSASEIMFSISTSPAGVARVSVDGDAYIVPSSDYTRAHNIGRLLTPSKGTDFASS